MTKKIKIKRGLEAALPTLQEGEPGFTTDSKKLFVGSDTGNIEIGGIGGGDVASLIEDLQDGTIIVGKATKDASGNVITSTYATKVENALKQSKSEKGQANGYASLDSSAKIHTSQLPDSILGQLEYKGVFNPNNGYPPSPEKGWYYISTHNGTANGDEYHIGDWTVYNGSSWDKVDNTDAVASVNEKTGNVVLDGTDLQVGNGDATTIEQRFVNIDDELDNRYTKDEVDLLTANGGGGGDVASLIEDLQDGRIIVGKATKDNGGNPLVQTYATSMDTSYDDINNKISIDLKNKEGNSLGTKIINLPLASYEKDGLLSAGEKNRIYYIPNDISSAISTHDDSATAHLPLRTLINDLQEEVDRLNAKGRSWGEIDKTFSELWAMAEPNRSNYINTFLATAFSGYTPSNGDLVYTIVGAAEEEHELEYNSTFSQWVDNGVYNYDKASNTKHGIVKGDLTYVSILNGIIQVLKSDYATNIGSSGASYDYDDLQALSTGLAGKVSKVTTAGISAYTKNGATQSTMNIDNASPTASTLVQRDANGRIKASAGVANNDVVNVQQLNNALGETYSKAEVEALIEQELNNALGDIDSALDTLMGV